jgi:transposase-like protein
MRLHFENNMSVNELAEQFNLPRQTIYGWRSQFKEHGPSAFIGCGHGRASENELSRLREELERLKRENKRLQDELTHQ